ncbi:TPM domain-containing protein [Moraxella nasovis]|uniref:TPM domain-containing protein n=1 Tax=Moraxella nasovis TaxID=2904121 RepID=UPI001F624C4C|nr:TPM domain-containing protein [Moraxella nasovis]UNU73007.1 TPM domain-containing protein [Moraxella nasovis]
MQTIKSTKSLRRLIRQLCFIPLLHRHDFSKHYAQDLAGVVSRAEQGHDGEIRLIIEEHLPIAMAYATNCRERALSLFASHHVWDTEQNTGVLIYVNICEHSLEIIADRGIDRCATETIWQQLAADTIVLFRQGKMQEGLERLLIQVGDVLRQHFPSDDVMGNELPDEVIVLK